MYRYFSQREQKAYCIVMVLNALIADGILYSILRPDEPLTFLVLWFLGILVFQLNIIIFSEFIQRYCFKKISPLEEQLILRRKITCIKEEIQRINGQPYDKDVFHNY